MRDGKLKHRHEGPSQGHAALEYMRTEYDYHSPSVVFYSFAPFLLKCVAMKLSGFVSLLLVGIVGFIYAEEQWPLHNDGINSVVEWYAPDPGMEYPSHLIVLEGIITVISSMDNVSTSGPERLVCSFSG